MQYRLVFLGMLRPEYALQCLMCTLSHLGDGSTWNNNNVKVAVIFRDAVLKDHIYHGRVMSDRP